MVRPANALSLGHACSWLTHVLSLPDKEEMLLLPWLRLQAQAGMINLNYPQMVLILTSPNLSSPNLSSSFSQSQYCDAQDAAPSF